MNHVERQPERAVVNKLDYLQTVVNDLRQVQSFGSSNVRTYRLFNPSTNVEITLSSVTATNTRCVEVTLTPNTAASNPLIAFSFQPSFTSPSGGLVTNSVVPLVPVSGVQKFRIYLVSGDVTKDISLAFNFWTISPGTYTAAEVTP